MADLTITSGSDAAYEIAWTTETPDAQGVVTSTPINLTGHSVSIHYEPARRALGRHLSASITNAAQGLCQLEIEGGGFIQPGQYEFRVKITSAGGDDISSPAITCEVV